MQPNPEDVEREFRQLSARRSDDAFYAVLYGKLLAHVEMISEAHAEHCGWRQGEDVGCRVCAAIRRSLAVIEAERMIAEPPKRIAVQP
jgi:hypothetical protein